MANFSLTGSYSWAFTVIKIRISSNNCCPSMNRLPRIIAPSHLAIFSFFCSLPVKLKIEYQQNHGFCYSFFYDNVHAFHFFHYSLDINIENY